MMTKHYTLGLLTLLLSANTAMADPIGLSKAKQLAAKFAKANSEVSYVSNSAKSKSLLLTSSSETTEETQPYYIFSRGEGEGFVIVSGDDCLPEILGYTESGDFEEDNMPPALLEWLSYYAQLVDSAQQSGENVSRSSATYVKSANLLTASSTKVSIPALVSTHWHQSSPYNNLCPTITSSGSRAATGCVATAATQILYYYQKDNPDSLLSTTPTYSYGDAPVTVSYPKGTPLKWGLMLTSYSGTRPDEFDEAVATLMAAAGAATWLTYGSSTSGQINNVVNTYSSYFRMSSVCEYKSGYSQTAWENKIYTDLAAGRPILYSGVHSTSGGHAVILDGYQASTGLYHFNFGWGGSGDGWYTVDDETGMNGFSSSQGMVYNIMPKKQNLSAEVKVADVSGYGRSNNIEVTVSNNGTLSYTGIYAFANTTGSKPTSLSSSKDEDTETAIASGEQKSFTFSFKPTTEKTWYIYITDKNLNVLATDTTDVEPTECELALESIEINGSDETETYNGEEYTVVYNSSTYCLANVKNISDTDFDGNLQLTIYSSEDGGQTFTEHGKKYSNVTIGANSSATVSFSVTSTTSAPLVEGNLYYGLIKSPVSTLYVSDTIRFETTDTLARFIIKESTLAAETLEDGILKFSGNWDAKLFESTVSKSAYDDAMSYDLTNVTGIKNVPELSEKPNALFYVADDTNVNGNNVVNATTNTCKSLSLTVGYDFCPKASFTAESFELNIAQEPNKWYMLTALGNVEVPDGILARRIDSHNSSGISNKTTNVTSLEAGKTYLVMTSSKVNQTLEGENVEIAGSVVQNVDTNVVGCYVATEVPEGSYLLSQETNYFEAASSGETTEALRGYFLKNSTISASSFRGYSKLTIDPSYITLGESIDSCLEILEEYKEYVKEEAYDAFADSIDIAENIFSTQSLENSIYVKRSASSLLEYAEEYKLQLKDYLEDADIDLTGLITNPSFELGTMSGWTTGASTAKSVKISSNYIYTGVGSDGSYLLYNLDSDSLGVEVSQEITGLIPGVYTLTAMMGTDGDNTVTMFAGDKESTVSAHSFGRFYLKENKIEGIEVGEDSTLTIGIKAGRWYKADDFKLVCNSTSGIADYIIDVVPENITSSNNDVRVKVEGNTVIITPTKLKTVTVVNTVGAKVWQKKFIGTQKIQLPAGTYIIDKNKVMVK